MKCAEGISKVSRLANQLRISDDEDLGYELDF